MMLTDSGLRLSKPELAALLAFSADNQTSSFYGVHFKAIGSAEEDPIVKARATDGRIAVDAFGHCTPGINREWFVSRAFLSGVAKLADSSHSVLLKFSGASLHEASVEDHAGMEVATFSVPGEGAAHAQMSFVHCEDWDMRLKIPTRQRGVRCLSMKTGSLKLLAKLGAAAGVESVDCYPPQHDNGRLLVRAEGNDTTWVAVIDPAPVTDED